MEPLLIKSINVHSVCTNFLQRFAGICYIIIFLIIDNVLSEVGEWLTVVTSGMGTAEGRRRRRRCKVPVVMTDSWFQHKHDPISKMAVEATVIKCGGQNAFIQGLPWVFEWCDRVELVWFHLTFAACFWTSACFWCLGCSPVLAVSVFWTWWSWSSQTLSFHLSFSKSADTLHIVDVCFSNSYIRFQVGLVRALLFWLEQEERVPTIRLKNPSLWIGGHFLSLVGDSQKPCCLMCLNKKQEKADAVCCVPASNIALRIPMRGSACGWRSNLIVLSQLHLIFVHVCQWTEKPTFVSLERSSHRHISSFSSLTTCSKSGRTVKHISHTIWSCLVSPAKQMSNVFLLLALPKHLFTNTSENQH